MTYQDTDKNNESTAALTIAAAIYTAAALGPRTAVFRCATYPRLGGGGGTLAVSQSDTGGGNNSDNDGGRRAGWRNDSGGRQRQRKTSVDEDIWRWTFETN